MQRCQIIDFIPVKCNIAKFAVFTCKAEIHSKTDKKQKNSMLIKLCASLLTYVEAVLPNRSSTQQAKTIKPTRKIMLPQFVISKKSFAKVLEFG